ncbi:MAG: acyltransferase family protein [Clostridia bacterium]|nr:acyltransferase family protein [Clostridia bacterium]
MNNTSVLTNPQRKERNSAIELLKIAGILLIVMSHVIQSLRLKSSVLPYSDYVIDTAVASQSLRVLILRFLSYSGQFGNWLFYLCSAWFLLDSRQNKKSKITFLILNVWTVSVIILTVYLASHHSVSAKTAVRCLFPTSWNNNWYITCYILLYAVYPYFNILIEKLSQKQLFALSASGIVLYMGINFLKESFFSNKFIIWTAVYFAVAYAKKYLPSFTGSVRANVILFASAMLFHIALMLLTNLAGLRISAFSNQMNHWINISNPMLLAMAAALFNIVRNVHFTSRAVNYVSGLSLLIYIIHENILVRTYLRPYVWHLLYNQYGYTHLAALVFVYTVALFSACALLATVYRLTLERIVIIISGKLTAGLLKVYHKIESAAIKIR